MSKLIDKLAFNAALSAGMQNVDPHDADLLTEMTSGRPDGQYISVANVPEPQTPSPISKQVGPPPMSQMVPEQPPAPPAPAPAPAPAPGAPPVAPPAAAAPPQGQPMPPAQPPVVQATPPAAPPMPPKTASLAEKLAYQTVKKAFGYGMGFAPHSQMGFAPPMGNQYGFPGQMNYNAPNMNPSYFQRPGVGQFGGFGMMGNPPMTKEVLEQNYNREQARIQNLAGQINEETRKPYTAAEITRMDNDLRNQTTRQLETMKQVQNTYGAGGGAGASPFGPSGGPGMPGGHGFGGHPGGHAMPNGLPGFMPATGVPFGGSPYGPGANSFTSGGFNPSMPFGSGGSDAMPDDVAEAKKLIDAQKTNNATQTATSAQDAALRKARWIELNKRITNRDGYDSDEKYTKAVEEIANQLNVTGQLQRADNIVNPFSRKVYNTMFEPMNEAESGLGMGGLSSSAGGRWGVNNMSIDVGGDAKSKQRWLDLKNMKMDDMVKYLRAEEARKVNPNASGEERNSVTGLSADTPEVAAARAKVNEHKQQQAERQKQLMAERDYDRKAQQHIAYQQRSAYAKAHRLEPPPPPPGMGTPATGVPATAVAGGAGGVGGAVGGAGAGAGATSPATGGAGPAVSATVAPGVSPRPAASPAPVPTAGPPPGGGGTTGTPPPAPAGGTAGAATPAAKPPVPGAPPVPPPAAGAGAVLPGMDKPASHCLTRPTVTQLAKMAARSLEKRSTGTNPLTTLLKLMGVGTAAGGAIGGLTAPSDYAPEGILRGARLGLMAGAGAGVGGMAGSMASRGLGKSLNMGKNPANPAELYPVETMGHMGKVLGGGLGAAGAAITDSHKTGPAAWEQGKLPLMEQLDGTLRRRVNQPNFKAAASALKSMGVLSDRDDQKKKQDAASSEGRKSGFMGVFGAGGGAAGGAAVGALGSNRRMRGKAVGKGALIGGVGGLLAGSLAGAHRGHVLGRDSNKPGSTWLERRAPSVNPVGD